MTQEFLDLMLDDLPLGLQGKGHYIGNRDINFGIGPFNDLDE